MFSSNCIHIPKATNSERAKPFEYLNDLICCFSPRNIDEIISEVECVTQVKDRKEEVLTNRMEVEQKELEDANLILLE